VGLDDGLREFVANDQPSSASAMAPSWQATPSIRCSNDVDEMESMHVQLTINTVRSCYSAEDTQSLFALFSAVAKIVRCGGENASARESGLRKLLINVHWAGRLVTQPGVNRLVSMGRQQCGPYHSPR
jgi:hypothetical protein